MEIDWKIMPDSSMPIAMLQHITVGYLQDLEWRFEETLLGQLLLGALNALNTIRDQRVWA